MPLSAKDPDALEQIAQLISDGADPEVFADLLDEILGTGIKKVDPELENEYERGIREESES